MADCMNVEIRELLPERASGALSAADVARVDAHLAGCGLCVGELALIQSARAVLRREPRIDSARLAASVVARTAGTPSRPVLVAHPGGNRRVYGARWIGWKAAAAVAIAAAGAGTMLVHSRVASDSAPSGLPGVAAVAPTTGNGASTPAGASPAAATPGLNVAGGLADLSDADLRSLLDEVGSLGVAEPTFEEPGAVLPDLPGAEGVES